MSVGILEQSSPVNPGSHLQLPFSQTPLLLHVVAGLQTVASDKKEDIITIHYSTQIK